MTETRTLTIKDTAAKSGLSAYTLRYYEHLGLLNPIHRDSNGHRRYTEADLEHITLLKRLRATGMSLDEMKRYIDLWREGSESFLERRMLLQQQREKVQAQIDELCDVLAFIDHKLAVYDKELQKK